MSTITTGTSLFPSELAKDIFVKVNGFSSLAKLSGQSPVPFAGEDTFVFTMDSEAAVVGEGGTKPAGEATFDPVTIKPVKFVYQHRVTEEFLYLGDEKQLPYLQAFTDGFSRKIARALDIAAMHGVNPYDGETSTVIGGNSFDEKCTSNIVTYSEDTPDDDLNDAANLIIAADGIVTGAALSPVLSAALGSMKTTDGLTIYPEFRFGNNPENFGGMSVDVNNTVSFNSSVDRAIVGDFENAFKWGYSLNIPMKVIEYGDPDGLGDLQRMNQIVLRAEAYIGWAILDEESFALVQEESAS